MPPAPLTPPGTRGPEPGRTPAQSAPRSHPNDPLRSSPRAGNSAVVYCEANFGSIDGKTANGLVRYSEKYEILSVIDSEKSGLDAGEVLGDDPSGIPICASLADAIALVGRVPDFFIFGIAPASGMFSPSERRVMLDAIGLGMSIVNGLHEFLNDDPQFSAAAEAHNVTILDIRRPRDKKTSGCSAAASLRSHVRASRCWAPTVRLASGRPRRS